MKSILKAAGLGTKASFAERRDSAPRGKRKQIDRMERRLSMDWSKFDLAMEDPRYLHGAPVF
jgi:hypothetical protein